MGCPFPGMDPWLEHPALWPGVHNSLIGAIRDDLAQRLAPRYFVALEMRTYRLSAEDDAGMGLPDLAIMPGAHIAEAVATYEVAAEHCATVVEVAVPAPLEVGEAYLLVRAAGSRELVTAIELLSPANKLLERGRRAYLKKRYRLFESLTNLIEIDLLRNGQPMPVSGPVPRADYRVLVSRGHTRPRAQLYVFNLPDPLPTIPVPLRPGEDEPPLDLNAVLHGMYRRGRYDLGLDYGLPPLPPLGEAAGEWARSRVAAALAGAAG